MPDSVIINNPNPVTPGACGKFWVSDLVLSPASMVATLRPFDGHFVVGNPSKARRIIATLNTDAVARAAADAVCAKLKALAGKTAEVSLATIRDADPLGVISITVIFADKSIYRVPDLMGLLGRDQDAALAYGMVLTYLASRVPA